MVDRARGRARAARHRRRLRVERVQQGAPEHEFGWCKAQVVRAVRGRHRHDLHRQLHRRTHPGPPRSAAVALTGGIIYCRRHHARLARHQGPALAARARLRRHRRVSASAWPTSCRSPCWQKWFPDKRGPHHRHRRRPASASAPSSPAPSAKRLIAGTRRQDQGVPAARHRLPRRRPLGACLFRNPPAGLPSRDMAPARRRRAKAQPRPGRDFDLRARRCARRSGTCSPPSSRSTCCAASPSSRRPPDRRQRPRPGITAGGRRDASSGVLGLFNGAGRIRWGWLSDRIGRMPRLPRHARLQGVCFLLLPHIAFAIFAILAGAASTSAYGGGFGTMPSTAADFFGTPQRRCDLRRDDHRLVHRRRRRSADRRPAVSSPAAGTPCRSPCSASWP